MSKELVISANRHETRVAVLEDDQVVEVFYQRENEYSLAGSIHKGRVTRVLPGMQSAFVDIGLGRDAFLYVSDFFEDNEEYDKIVTSVEEKVRRLDRTPAALLQAVPLEAAPDAVPAPAAADAAAVPVAVAPPAPLSPPASAMQGPPGFQGNRRPDRGGDRGGDRGPDRGGDRGPDRGGDRGGDQGGGGDRRARRSRRGRGQRSGGGSGGGRGLPDAKSYSPRPDAESRHQASPAAGIPEAAPVGEPAALPRVVFDPEQDDFFVLPGESLAKYTGRAEDEPDEQTAVEPPVEWEDTLNDPASRELQAIGEVMAETAYDRDHTFEGATKRMQDAAEAAEAARAEEPVVETAVIAAPAAVVPVMAAGPAPVATPEPVAVPEVVAPETAPEPVAAAAAPVVAEEPPAARLEEELTPIQVVAEETGFGAKEPASPRERGPGAAGAGEATEAAEVGGGGGVGDQGADGEDEAEADAEGVESPAEGEASEEGAAQPVTEDEGLEPARTPTSLTAPVRGRGGRVPPRRAPRTPP